MATVYLMVNFNANFHIGDPYYYQLKADRGVRWPISYNCIVGSDVELIEVKYLLKVNAVEISFFACFTKQAKKDRC